MRKLHIVWVVGIVLVLGDWAQKARAVGLGGDETWHGKWIAGERKPAAPLLRKEFVLAGKVRRAEVRVSGVGYFELRVNGRKIGNHGLDPGLTDFDKRVLYTTFDVTDEVRSGANAVGVILGTGWFDVHQTD